MEWLNRINDAINYIETHLDDEISYEEAARIACCSTYYFQRMFTYITGISLSEYIRRRRMTQAAFELQQTDKRVLEIALKYGYTSPTSFNRAFQNVHGISPTAAKDIGSTLNAYPPIRFSVNIAGACAMPYHIEEKSALHIVGVRTPLVEDMETNLKNVPEFWRHISTSGDFHQLCNFASDKPKEILGVSIYNGPNDFFYYIAVATDASAPRNMHEYAIPAATWVVFKNDGYFKEDVQNIFRRFYTEWLPFSGYEYAGLPDLEVYPIVDDNTICGHSEVWIAIKKKRSID